ncbi:DNA cytosine methyltransferase [Embleya scabrispora]|uniref:DNA cytosine methyltransferase n=1 Tax=Embleya scabrispora TaxID=159449 RepID=UPI00035F581C|nr:DNA cytosine methyltransferase [Embleya scabrispora]
MARPITMIDLFAGCGGMTSGFAAAKGFRPVMAVEWNLHAAATYAANFGEAHMRWGDIAEIPDKDIPRADLIIGGPPCQGFSNLGSRNVEDPRNKLWKEYLRFVRRARPKVFVIENVDRFQKSAEFALLLAEAQPGGLLEGYVLTDALLPAVDYGVPQRRKRAIVIGSRIGEITVPEPTHGPGRPQRWKTVRDAIEHLPRVPGTTSLPVSKTEFFGRAVPGVFKEADLHLARTPIERSLLRYDCVPPGGGRFDLPDHLLPDCWRNKKTGTTDVMGRMRWDHPSLTIRTEFYKPEKGQYLHPQWNPDDPTDRVNRPITHREAARLQSFPETFVWCGSKTEIARQIGNAVPPRLAEAIARHLKPHLRAAR